MNTLADLSTPALVLDEAKVRHNVNLMAKKIGGLGCRLRPHVKTHKSLEVAQIVEEAGHTAGIAVSTLAEARYFFAAGFRDIMYAVGLSDGKVEEVAGLLRDGCDLKVITDNLAMARRIADAADVHRVKLPTLIELDVDGHRSGVDPDAPDLMELSEFIDQASSMTLEGVMTHAGESYSARTPEELAFHANREVSRTRKASDRLRAAGHDCRIVSIGSTPTAASYTNLEGITEVRAGVYTLFDLVQAGIGIADRNDIAASVLTTVIGHQTAKGWVITDAGWMAMSRDRGTADQDVDFGYGQVCDLSGAELDGVIVSSANQEHGIVSARKGLPSLDLAAFPIGSRLRIKPNHACATAGQFDHFDVIRMDGTLDKWERLRGR